MYDKQKAYRQRQRDRLKELEDENKQLKLKYATDIGERDTKIDELITELDKVNRVNTRINLELTKWAEEDKRRNENLSKRIDKKR